MGLSTEDQASYLVIQLHISEVFLEFFQGLELERTQASTTARLGRSQALDKANDMNIKCHVFSIKCLHIYIHLKPKYTDYSYILI